jgi:hypothetical protein
MKDIKVTILSSTGAGQLVKGTSCWRRPTPGLATSPSSVRKKNTHRNQE